MFRKSIVVGDSPLSGGEVLAYAGPISTIHGHQVGLIGGRVYCQGCNSVGIIAKAGGTRREGFYDAEVALEGDVVVCSCRVPPPLVSILQSTSYCDDSAGGSGEFQISAIGAAWYTQDTRAVAASKTVVDGFVEHPPEAEQTENICPNMTNKAFVSLVLELRDRAAAFLESRIQKLETWDKDERQRVLRWFGRSDEDVRQYLRSGLRNCLRVTNGLTGDNFVRYSETAMRNVGCTPSGNKAGLVAEVCKPDIKTHTIAIALEFCSIPKISYSIDSQLGTIIHEVTHFDDTFSSTDTVYKMSQSLALASRPAEARSNADSITGYVLYGD